MNLDAAELINKERLALLPLPETRGIEYEEAMARVISSSTIAVKGVTYSVDNKFIGVRFAVKIYNQKLDCFLGSELAATLIRVPTPAKGSPRKYVINYLHVIHSLAAKPRAFRSCIYRDEILPTTDYVYIWDHVDKTMEKDEACKFIVKLLLVAANYNCRDELARVVIDLIKREEPLKITDLQDLFKIHKTVVLKVQVSHNSLDSYNELIPGLQKEYHA